MIQFSRLRLSGFKSFVDKTELEIGQGMNGIVGPNGCGKSNLVEALRWVMGESSAKKMRGGGMDDVIFAGTDKRSARNIAEVSLLLDNSTRKAPSQYNAHDEIEVVRRIERDQGSSYKINGRPARARDVQMLFADTVTGSNSPALVSQGHVTRMINAKPHDRRMVLEESAGISGLYARRHEAELRLKAADTNLIRVEDILGSMETRLSSLKRQARQAGRYRNINAQIRQLELIITYLEWRALSDKQAEMKRQFGAVESVVAEKLGAVTQLTKTQNTQIEDLPPLRKKEAELAASLQTQKIALQRFEDERERHAGDLRESQQQLVQTKEAAAHERQSLEESVALLEKILVEERELAAESGDEDAKLQDKEKARDVLEEKVKGLEARFTALKESAAESRARQAALLDQIKAHERRLETLQGRMTQAQNDKDALDIPEDNQIQIEALVTKIASLEKKQESFGAKTVQAKEDIAAAEAHTEVMRKELSERESALVAFRQEISTLESFFKGGAAQDFVPVLDVITTQEGFEKALSRALGDSLMASLEDGALSRWVVRDVDIKALPSLPSGVQSLLPFVDAPAALHAALSQIGFVADEAEGDKFAGDLASGQALVSGDGTYWRWDGFTVHSGAADLHSLHLEQKNKLRALEAVRGDIEAKAASAREALDLALERQRGARDGAETLQREMRQIDKTLAEARPALSKIREKTARIAHEQARLDDVVQVAREDISQVQEALERDRYTLEALENSQGGDHAQAVTTAQEDLAKGREAAREAIRAYDLFIQQQSTRRARMQAIADERISLQNRSIRAREHLKVLDERIEGLQEKYASLSKLPKNFDKGQEDLLIRVDEIERARNEVAARLEACETEVGQTSKALKEAERLLGDAREERARVQATLAAINEQFADMERSIEEKLEVKPVDLVNHAAVDLVKHRVEDIEALKVQRDKLVRERESIGPVNLRAEEETQALETELTGLLHERNDLMQAIDELRGGIQKINREARERLVAAFGHVNAHFQRLFVQLFGGGKAHLALIDSDDPLGAGLEIFAQPPGKALQSLSLLSGGEQTLASIALIFAMFLTNPSPICVLDEIDAPLDDANVDRVCNLLEEIAERGETRFMVITHHRLTMARMDRLYGVTMAEKGISQLVSVDLQQSFDFVDKEVA
ncbi:MAG: chromosome segregation protein SMC [Alphaproteobacteria bacterium]|nr:chromosome segregation protein SMC [Alphaproteobacteria bacterium]